MNGIRFASSMPVPVAMVAPQGALRKLHCQEIPFETLQNHRLCISWAFCHVPENISEMKLRVKSIGIIAI